MKKKIIILPCIAAVAIATYVGEKTLADDRIIVRNFPVEKELSGENIDILDCVNKPFALNWNSGHLFLSLKGDYHLAIYSERENSISYALRKGHGHDEWVAPMITTQQFSVNNNIHTCVLERAGSKLYGINLLDSISPRYCIQDFNKKKLPGIRNVFLLPDGSYCGILDDEVCDMFYYNDKNKELTKEEIEIDHGLFTSDSRNLSQNMATYNPQSNKIAIAYYTFPMFFIKKADAGSAQLQIQIGESVPEYTEENSFDPHFYILDLCSTDKYIYILFDDPQVHDKTYILVFDWNGVPIAKYQTDRLTAFTVDEANSRFFTINEDDSDASCSIYRINRQ